MLLTRGFYLTALHDRDTCVTRTTVLQSNRLEQSLLSGIPHYPGLGCRHWRGLLGLSYPRAQISRLPWEALVSSEYQKRFVRFGEGEG